MYIRRKSISISPKRISDKISPRRSIATPIKRTKRQNLMPQRGNYYDVFEELKSAYLKRQSINHKRTVSSIKGSINPQNMHKRAISLDMNLSSIAYACETKKGYS